MLSTDTLREKYVRKQLEWNEAKTKPIKPNTLKTLVTAHTNAYC